MTDERESDLIVARLDRIAGKLNELRHADRTLSLKRANINVTLDGPVKCSSFCHDRHDL
jgi:hypothetical protein